MEYHWPFAVCICLVSFFAIGAVFLLRRHEGARVISGPRKEEDEVEDPSLADIVPIGYLCREEFWSSCGGALNPNWLLLFRAFCVAYLFPMLVYIVVENGVSVFLHYTQWTFTLLIVYFALAFRQSLLHYLEERPMASANRIKKSPKTTDHDGLLNVDREANGVAIVDKLRSGYEAAAAGVEGYVTQCVFQALFPAVVLTDLVYWGFLVPVVLPPNFHHGFIDIHTHAVNMLLLTIEFSLSSLRFPWFRIGYLILWSAAYCALHWILYCTGVTHRWPYPFMEVDTPYAPVWYLLLILVHGVCYVICLLLALAKQSVWSRFNVPAMRGRMSF